LDGVIDASGAAFHILADYIGWIKTVIVTIVKVQVAVAYNTLKDKVYEHKNSAHDLFEQLAKKVDIAETVIINNRAKVEEDMDIIRTAADNLEGTMNMRADGLDSQLSHL
jgi:uncharacterized protein YabE (DUF348 family)